MPSLSSETEFSPIMSLYSRFPLTLKKGKGSYVWDTEGQKYLDFTAGIAVLALGHVPDAVKAAVTDQLNAMWHCSNLFHIAQQEELAAKLTQLAGMDQAFFCNSGAEANEGAIKMARLYAHLHANKPNGHIVTFYQSFHGRTMATLTATAQSELQEGFGPLLPGFKYLTYNDASALEAIAADEDCIAVMLEMVQGEGGVIPCEAKWAAELNKVCKKKKILIIVDEVQSGMGRTGSMFAYQQYALEPDIVTTAKALASGIPIGAFMAKREVSRVMTNHKHGSTFGGNPLATAAGVATLKAFEDQHVLETCRANAIYLSGKLKALAAQFPESICAVRGKGLLIGVETSGAASDIVTKLREQYHVLILTAGAHVLRILPPLVTNEEEIDEFIAALEGTLKSL
ncbi:MAG: aspartate aminotransferase family protein [Sporolactobacillus sp.]